MSPAQRFDEIENRAVDEFEGGYIYNNSYTIGLESVVVFTHLIIKIEGIGETRTTATIHGDAQHVRFTAFGFEKPRQLFDGALAETNANWRGGVVCYDLCIIHGRIIPQSDQVFSHNL